MNNTLPEHPERVTIEHCRALLHGPAEVMHAVITVVFVDTRPRDGMVLTRTRGWLMVLTPAEEASMGAKIGTEFWPWQTWRVGHDALANCTYYVLGEDVLERQAAIAWRGADKH